MGLQLITYKSYQECFDSLTKMGANVDEVTHLLNHEREHYNKSLELGYEPIYGIHMIPDFPPVINCGYIDFKDKVPEGQDLIDILLAPETPGDHDFALAEKIKTSLGYQVTNP